MLELLNAPVQFVHTLYIMAYEKREAEIEEEKHMSEEQKQAKAMGKLQETIEEEM